MPSLIDCLGLAGKLFQKDEKDALIADAKQLQEGGLSQQEAEKQAVRNQIESSLKTLRDIHRQADIETEPLERLSQRMGGGRKTASWVIRNKDTKEVIAETFEKSTVDRLNKEKYEAIPIGPYLASLSDPSVLQNLGTINQPEKQNATQEIQQPESIQEQPQGRIESGQAQEASPSDSVRSETPSEEVIPTYEEPQTPDDLPNATQASRMMWYHGTGAQDLNADTVSSTFAKIEGLFGSGFYMTDRPEIAKTYATKNRNPTIYQVQVEPRKVLNFDRAIPEEAVQAIQDNAYEDFRAAIAEAASKEGATGASIWKALTEAVTEHSQDNGWSSSEYAEMFNGIENGLRQAGYDGITHIGGLRAGKGGPKHRVLIMLDAADDFGSVDNPLPRTVYSVKPTPLLSEQKATPPLVSSQASQAEPPTTLKQTEARIAPTIPEEKIPQRIPVAPGASSTTEWRTRNFARRFTKDERINEETREQVPTEYLPITNQDTVDQVKEKVDQNGLVASAAQVMDFTNDLSPAQRVAMAELVLLRLNEASKLATKQNNVQDAAELNSLASDVAMEISSYGTRLGQGVQAFAIWNKLTPEGLIASTEKDIRNHGRPEGLTEEEKAKLRPLAEATREAPEGFLKNDAMRKYFLASSKLKGIKWTDMLTAYWYANILSGINTQGINVFGSGINGAIQFLAQSTFTNPKDTMRFVQGMLKAATSIAAQEADATFISGSESQRLMKKFDAEPSALAQLYDPEAKGIKRIKNAFSYGEYVFRALQAADAFMYRSFAEGQAYLDASRAAREKGGNYSANFLEQIGMTDEMRTDALKQAQSEVEEFGTYKNERQKKRDIARRAFEIMEASRNDEIRTSSDRFASLASYTNEPEGLVGQLARSMNQFVRSFSIQNKKTGERFTPLTFAVPFVNIVGNVLNGQLDMTPIGYVRAARGKAFIDEKIDSPRERMRRVALATIGSGFAAAIAGSAEAFLDDDDPYFAVYAEGPKDIERKRNLMSQGWKPFTFKIGDKYIRYNETPMNLMMATIGGVHDARRFGAAYNRKSMSQQAAYVTTLGIRSFSEAGFLSSVMSLSDVLSGDADVGQFLTRIGTGLIPAQGLMRDIAKSLDPVIVDKRESLWPAIVGDIPVVKGFGTRPMLNAFGDPVTYSFYDRLPFAGRLFSERSIDPEWRYLAETGLRLPGLNRPIETSVAGLTKREKRTLAEVLKNRGEQLGVAAAEVFTDAEQYEFVEKSGPKIKEAVKELRTQRSDMDKADQQDWLEKKVREIRTQTKKEILGID